MSIGHKSNWIGWRDFFDSGVGCVCFCLFALLSLAPLSYAQDGYFANWFARVVKVIFNVRPYLAHNDPAVQDGQMALDKQMALRSLPLSSPDEWIHIFDQLG